MEAATPVTVFTGFVGAGKTTIILDILRRVNSTAKLAGAQPPRIAILKNEYGDVAVDSMLARESALGVKEMLNGCLCCVLVGQLQDALREMRETYKPDRIIVECSGSAFPAPLAWQIRQLAPLFSLDLIITVVDCENFVGYEDKSYTAKMQAQYTDLILLTKWQHVSERQMDDVLDHVCELNLDTPRLRYTDDLPLDLFLGSHAEAAASSMPACPADHRAGAHAHVPGSDCCGPSKSHAAREFDVLGLELFPDNSAVETVEKDFLEFLLKSLPKDTVYRVKGFVRVLSKLDSEENANAATGVLMAVNHAFGRYTLTKLDAPATVAEVEASYVTSAKPLLRLTVMGQDLAATLKTFEAAFPKIQHKLTPKTV